MKTALFDSYRDKYENVRMKREHGILELALHTRGGPLEFDGYPWRWFVRSHIVLASVRSSSSPH
jgi:hypothetical protein